MCVTIKLVEGRIAWRLDNKNNALDLYKASQFMLSLLMAYRVVSLSKYALMNADCAPRSVVLEAAKNTSVLRSLCHHISPH